TPPTLGTPAPARESPAALAGVRRVAGAELDWQPSPSPLVWRKRLFHAGAAEAGVVTSIVRYDAGAGLHAHGHAEGEEILVLSGTFSDERGDFGAGSYMLNPEGFRHAPSSREGCVLFVKLRQYAGWIASGCWCTRARRRGRSGRRGCAR